MHCNYLLILRQRRRKVFIKPDVTRYEKEKLYAHSCIRRSYDRHSPALRHGGNRKADPVPAWQSRLLVWLETPASSLQLPLPGGCPRSAWLQPAIETRARRALSLERYLRRYSRSSRGSWSQRLHAC